VKRITPLIIIILVILLTAVIAQTSWAREDSAHPVFRPDAEVHKLIASRYSDYVSICGVIPTFEDGLAPSSELHVATTGNDLSGDGTPGNPFASIERAIDFAAPGTAIIVHAGTYAGGQYVADLHGTAVAPIWIGGTQGEAQPVISGGTNGIQFVRPNYLIVHDLEVSGASGNGINTDDGGDYADPLAAHHVIFRNLYIHHIGGGGNQDCLKLSGLNDYFVLDSEFAFCGGGGSGSGIDHVGCHHGLIAHNYLHDNSGNAVQTKGGSEDIEIRWNHIVDGGARALNMGGSTGYAYFRLPLSTTESNTEARNIRAIANLIEGSTAPLTFVGCVDCLAANNTIIDPGNWILRILQETVTDETYEFEACGNNTVANNLFYFDRSGISTYVNIGPNTAPDTFTFANNLWYAHDNPSQSTPSLPVTETNGLYGQDPLFFDGYMIDPSSPAFRSGMPISGVAGDIIGQCFADSPSIGAYEFLFEIFLPSVSR
jgi:hypothetical protein